jgi:peroxiredoxin
MPVLNNGQKFPKLNLHAVGGGMTKIDLPQDLAGSYSAILIYRGAWCPICNAQLADYAAHQEDLDRLGVKVIAFSSDDEATTAALAKKHHLTFPMGYGANVDLVVAATGAFANNDPHYLQPTNFILAPDGSILNALYSTNAMGRITAAEVVALVGYLQSQGNG